MARDRIEGKPAIVGEENLRHGIGIRITDQVVAGEGVKFAGSKTYH